MSFTILTTIAWVAALLWGHLVLPGWSIIIILSLLTAFHSSLQHEHIHGHPTSNQQFNDVCVLLPTQLFLPYYRFKQSHLKHHQTDDLTNPYEDPESWYHDPIVWERLPILTKRLLIINNTLVGRIILGPFISICRFIFEEIGTVSKRGINRRQIATAWFVHFTAIFLLSVGIFYIGFMEIVFYWLLSSYVALSLLMVRTFAEHIATDNPLHRTAIVEGNGFFSFLFLNNNFHAIHHHRPSLAWYEIGSDYEMNRSKYHKMNGAYVFKGYFEIFGRYAFRPKCDPKFPLKIEME